MPTAWFCIVAVMIAAYVVLDGFDIGAGIIYLLIARTYDDRRRVIRSIGPVWDGNEVWLLAAGGTLYFAYPQLYASAFSGFYLPLMMVLWLLMLRAIGIDDDPWATPRAIDLLISAFTGTRPERIQIDPRTLGSGPIGHFGFFRPHHRDTLWRNAANWLVDGL